MTHEKIFKRADGTKVSIEIRFYSEYIRSDFKYNVSVTICEPKKRTFRYVNSTDNYTWRKLSPEDKKVYEMEQNLKYVTIEEIQETALELWNKLKPNFKTIQL